MFFSVNKIFECSYLSFGFEIGHPLSMYVTRGMEEGHPKCLQMGTEGEGYHASCVRTHLHYLFSLFCLMVSYGNKSLFQYVYFSLGYCVFTSFSIKFAIFCMFLV